MIINKKKKHNVDELLVEIDQLKKQNSKLKNNKFSSIIRSPYKEFFDNAPLPYQSLDANGNIIAVNIPWLDFFGYSNDEVIGKSFTNFLCNSDLKIFPERFLKKSGEIVYMSLNGIIQNDKDGKLKATPLIQ